MKKIILFLVILMLFPWSAKADNENNGEQIKDEIQTEIDSQIQGIDTSQWDEIIRQLPPESQGVIGPINVKAILKKLVSGNFTFDIAEMVKGIGAFFFKEIVSNVGLMAKVLVLAIICGILNQLRSSFENESIGEIAHFVCYMLIIILVVQSFSGVINHGRETIQTMVNFMQLIFPTLLTLLVAMGGIASSAIFQPAIVLLLSTIGTFMKDVILPLILFSAILVVINNISEKIQLNKLAGFVRSTCNWILGILFTIYIGVLTIQGVTAASFDGISIRTAKFAIRSFIPIVGGMFSDSVDTIIGCSLLIKNAVGVIGLIVLALICVFPAMKILAMVFVYRLSAALLEPVGDGRVVQCLNEIANVLTVLFVTVVSVGIMFFITITLLIGAGNITVMMR